MGTVVRIEAYIPGDASAPKAFRAAFDRIGFLARKFSSYREDSELRQVEKRAGRARVSVSHEFAFLLGAALRIARESGGAFDPTVGRVTRLARADGWRREGPSARALREAWRRTGWRRVRLDETSRSVRFARRGMQLDLGGIAKGYIADEALEALAKAGAHRAMVAVAGDIAAGDPPPGDSGWRIGVDASGPAGSVERHLLLARQAVSASGSRERHFYSGGRRCSHIVNRRSPECTESRSAVSVVAPTGLLADGLATALAALGPDRAEPLLARHPEVVAYWSADGPGGTEASARSGRER